MDFEEEESHSGIRFNWNVFPTTRSEELQLPTPIGAIYNPLHHINSSHTLNRLPKRCRNCYSCLNRYVHIDNTSQTWQCSICSISNPLFDRHHQVTGHGPGPGDDGIFQLEELEIDGTIEYITPVDKVSRTVSTQQMMYLWIVDLTMDEDEWDSLKKSLFDTLESIVDEENTLIGIITFDSNVYIHEHGGIFQKCVLFHGSKIRTVEELNKDLQIDSSNSLNRFFKSVKERESIIKLLNSIKVIKQVDTKQRVKRSTGCVIDLGVKLLKLFNHWKNHLFLFLSGPCTYGPGTIVGLEKSIAIRSFKDIQKGFKNDGDFYKQISKTSDNISINIICANYDQSGIYEMEPLIHKTGGILIMIDSFMTNLFKQNMLKLFEQIHDDLGVYQDIHSFAEIKVMTSSNLEICGFINDGVLKNDSNNDYNHISDIVHGDGLSNVVKLPLITSKTNITVFFRVKTVGYNHERKGIPENLIVQFQTKYLHNDGSERLRITTLRKPTTNNQLYKGLHDGFDQECGIVIITRLILYNMNKKDAKKEIKEILLAYMKEFGIYIKNEPTSFKLHDNISNFPQFTYNLIKSCLISDFNNTPDENSYYKTQFLKSDTYDSLLMIQPMLTSYELSDESQHVVSGPVLLDTSSLKPNVVLLMDSFFHVLIHYGETVAHWRDLELDPMEYANVDELINLPKREAMEILNGRFPLSRYIVTDANESQDRFLISKLNPSDGVLSEDVSIQEFYRDLIKRVV